MVEYKLSKVAAHLKKKKTLPILLLIVFFARLAIGIINVCSDKIQIQNMSILGLCQSMFTIICCKCTSGYFMSKNTDSLLTSKSFHPREQ